jgi:ceramide glucosyltransferase
LRGNLQSFYNLEYPKYEIIYSVADEYDPAFVVALAVAVKMSTLHPDIVSKFVIGGLESGLNHKVNRLARGIESAKYEYLLFSDSNVRVNPYFLRRAISFFQTRRPVGIVSNLFISTGAKSLGSRLEALHLNGFIQAATVFLTTIGWPCVVGKSILVSREALDAIGGISTLENYLAEDYQLGLRVKEAGYRVVLSSDAVETVEVNKPLSEVWVRHRRWAIIRKRSGGPAYLNEIFNTPIPWVFLVGYCLSGHLWIMFMIGFLTGFIHSTVSMIMAKRYGQSWKLLDPFLLLFKDLGVAAIFWAGLFGRHTKWRGRKLTVGTKTLLTECIIK